MRTNKKTFIPLIAVIAVFAGCSGGEALKNDSKIVPEGYNRLVHEQSPYLQQHASNPVDWYPWGEEAFEKAKEEDKPIFLSIGYSTCHWCHVMEEEAFEDDEVAALMNDAFVSIKVDREERPDIDGIYMTVAQILTGGGGWPLNIVMTPEKLPFFAGTYIPKNNRGSMLGMVNLIPRIVELWETDREKIETSADQISAALTRATSGGQPGDAPTRVAADKAFESLVGSYDEQHGGFGNAPKFPSSHNVIFLIRYAHATGDTRGLAMAEHTLKAMRMGGMYDHLGFGFHRYSTDQQWLVPHFEKMLYDQALLTYAYVEAYAATGNEAYRQTASEIIEYILRDMTGPEGGFYSAEDADSDGEEGTFYFWTKAEMESLLGADAELVMAHFGVTEEGNYHDEAAGTLTGKNILHTQSAQLKTSEAIAKSRSVLFDARENRIRPGLDDKVLTDWNGLMIAALAKAGATFSDKQYLLAAEKAADFLWKTMVTDGTKLLHRYRAGEAAIRGHLDDYAFFMWGLIELYEATFDPKYIKKALALAEVAAEDFWDDQDGGFFFTADDGETLIARQKDSYDSAMPAGNSVMALALESLSALTGNIKLAESVERIGEVFSGEINRIPSAHSHLLTASSFMEATRREVIIVGDMRSDDTKALIAAYRAHYEPGAVLLVKDPKINTTVLHSVAPFSEFYDMIDQKATAYVCTNFVCELPTNDPEKMIMLIRESDPLLD